MRNVYLFIIALFFVLNSYSQNLQNAKWYFGKKAGISFLPTPAVPVALAGGMTESNESCATVSDQSGNLLFYTDGVTVWSKNHTVMLNGTGLKGHKSSTQGAVIVPKPGDPDNYYIITISGVTDDGINLVTRKGLFYNEVDMALNGGLGGIIPGVKNIPLKDHYGIPIDEGYTVNEHIGNYSEKLTSTVHSNSVDYWIVTQIDRFIYSYKVTSSGITLTPFTYSYTPNTVTNNENAGVGQMKISPDTQRIAIAYADGVYQPIQPIPEGLPVIGDKPGVVLGTFNNTTGVVNLDHDHPIVFSDTYNEPYGIEFSPNSKYVYFSSFGKIYYTASQTSTLYSESQGFVGALQLGLNGKIYLKKAINSSTLKIINAPNNFPTPDIQNDAVNIGPAELSIGLPQWVHRQESSCVPNLVLTGANNILLGQANRQASSTITASNTITENGSANYHAGNSVVLKSGFHGANGSSFRGYIEGCSISGAFTSLNEKNQSSELTIQKEEKEFFLLSPNPATDKVVISSDKVMTQLEVKSLTGTVFFSKTIKDKSHELNISHYPKGFYIVTAITESGEIGIKKLIKN